MPYFHYNLTAFQEDNMGYKKIDKSLDFADIVLASSLKHNRSLKLMEKIDKAIDWSKVESILTSIMLLAQVRKEPMLILHCCCLNA